MSGTKGDHILVVGSHVHSTVFRYLGTAKAMRTSRYRGKGCIYRVVVGDSWEPRLELEDMK